jgi:pimeloyl-ACP methyl ester carboxylesterase
MSTTIQMTSELSQLTEKIGLVYLKRFRDAQDRFTQRISGPEVRQAVSAVPASPWETWQNWSSYVTDAVQRLPLFWDTIRRRGNQFLEHERAGKPPVLVYDYEMIADGRTLERPVNYALVKILPPEGVRIDESLRPYLIVDPRAGHGPGIGGFKQDSQVGVALRAGYPVYFVIFFPEPVPGQTIRDVVLAQARFVEEVAARHPNSPKPVIFGNCQGGWSVMLLASARPEITGPLVINGAPMSYWSANLGGGPGESPMRYFGGLLGGTWLTRLFCDLGNGKFDGAHLVTNFEGLNPANTFWDKYYHLYANVDTEPPRFLEFERWWGGYYLLGEQEICSIVNELFIGNRLARGEIMAAPGTYLDLKDIRSPVVIFSSAGDNITPPQQALNWVADVYSSTEEIKANGQVIVGLFHESVGHLGVFVSGKVARKEYTQIVEVLKSIEQLSPGLYLMKIQEAERTNGRPSYTVSFEEKELEDLRRLNKLERRDERPFAVVSAVSDLGEQAYLMLVRPWLEHLRSEPSAQLGRVFHPQRVQQWGWSDLNPLMWPLAPLAESVKAARRPVEPENPCLALERLGSEAISASWDLVRDLRDAAIESMFFLTYGGLLTLGIPADRGPDPGPVTTEPRDHPLVRKALEAIDRGGFLEAIARVGALLASQRGEFPLGRLELACELQQSDPVLSKLSEDEARRVRAEQSTLVELEPQRALEALPRLLADPRDRAHVIELLEKAAAMVELNADQAAMMDRIRQALAPADAAPRRDSRHRRSLPQERSRRRNGRRT